MWHHRTVFRPNRLACFTAVLAQLCLPGPCSAQPQARRPQKASDALRHSSADPHFLLQQLESAIQVQAAAVQGGDPATIASTSRALNAQIYFLLAQFRLAQGNLTEATMLYRSSLEQQPSLQRQLEYASSLLHAHHSAAALSEAEAVLAIDPQSVAALVTEGSAQRDLGRGSEAVVTLSRALQIHPEPQVAFALGSTYLSLHEKEKADGIFQQLLRSDKNPIWLVATGDAYRDAGYLQDAVTNLKTALALDPKVFHGEFFLGFTYLQLNQWGPNADSYEHLRRAVELNPGEYVSNFYLGALESTDGRDLVASDRHLQTAAAADPTQPEVWLYLGLNANREKRSSEAKTDLQKAITLTGSDESRNNYQVRRAYFTLGRLLVTEGDRPEGEKLLARYKQAAQAAVAESGKFIAQTNGMNESSLGDLAKQAPSATGPEPAQADDATGLREQTAAEDKLKLLLASSLNDLGTAEARQHDYSAALSDFQQSEHWDPTRPLVLRNLGAAAFRMKDNAEAARALSLYAQSQKAAGQTPDPHSELLLAISKFSLGHFAEAATSFAAAGNVALQDPTTAYSYAFSLARTGHAQEANHIAEQLNSQALPRDILPLVCHIFIDTEDFKDSQTCYRKALAAEPNLALAHYEIGESLIRLDQPAEAIPELRTELQQDAGNPNVRTALAFALLQTSQKDEARTLLEATVQAHPEHAEAQYQYGKLLLEEGKVQESIAHLEASEVADGSKDFVHYQLGTAFRKAGRTADAEREFKLYRQIKDKNRDANAVPH